MLTLSDRASIRAAARDPTRDPNLRAVLSLRFAQMGGAGADFHVCDRADGLDEAEAAVGWPLLLDGEPCWEWAEHHPGWTEVVFVLSDDGPAQVLLAPTGSPIAALVAAYEDQPARG